MDFKFEFPAAPEQPAATPKMSEEPLVNPGIPAQQSTSANPGRLALLLMQQSFAQFVHVAELKIHAFLFRDLDKELDLYALYKDSVDSDTSFTAILHVMASLAATNPKFVIDLVMVWRKSKNDAGATGDSIAALLQDPAKRQDLHVRYPALKGKELENILRERRSILANFILCHVFSTILSRLSKAALPEDLGAKMEDMVFGQLNYADPDIISRHINRFSNVEYFAKLSGSLSDLRFPTLSDRFMTEIKKLGTSKEAKLELMIRCMRFLKIKIYPMDELEESADFLRVCGDFFQDTHSFRIKNAFALTFVDFLEPVAAVATAEVNLPMWMKTIEIIFPKATRMLLKPKHSQTAVPLVTTLLCVSKKDFFLKNWVVFSEQLIQKFKERDRLVRHLALTSLVRLIWVYLYRCPESSPASMQKRLEFLLKHMTGRRGMVPSDTDPDLHVRIIYYVLNKFPEFGAEVVLSTLLGTNPAVALQQFIPGSPSTMTSLHIDEEPIYGSPQVLYSLQAPQLISSSISVASTSSLGESSIPFEKYVVALRAFKYHLNDVQALQVSTAAANSSQSSSFGRAGSFSGNSSNFGTSYIVVESKMTLSAPPFPTYSDTATFEVCDAISHTPKSDTVLPDVISHHSYAKLSGSIRSILDKANEVMGSLGPILESSFSKSSISELISGSQYSTAPMTPNAMSSRRSSFSDSTGSMYLSGPADMKQTGERPMILEMLKTWMDLIPTASPTGMSPQSVIALIARQVFSGHDYIRDSALKALLRMASIKTEKNDFWKLDVGEWSTFVLDTMMQNALSYFTEGLSELLASTSVAAVNAEKFLVEAHNQLLQVCIRALKDGGRESNWRSFVERTEGYALIFLSSHSAEVRKGALEVLRQVTKLDEEMDANQRFRSLKSPVTVNISIGPTLKRPLQNSEALEPKNSRILRIFKLCGSDLVKRNYNDPSLSMGARMNYLNKDLDEKDKAYKAELLSDPDPLSIVLASSFTKDNQIWRRCFPDLVRGFYEYAPTASLSYSISQILTRIQALSSSIQAGADASVRLNSSGTVKWNTPDKLALGKRLPLGLTEELIQQWSLYLCFSCAVSGVITQPELALQFPSRFQTSTVKNIFTNMFDLLSSDRTLVRHGVVTAFGCVQSCNYGILLECIQPYLSSSIEDMKTRMTQPKDTRKGAAAQSLASQKKFERQRMELVHVLSFMADFIDYEEYKSNLELTTSITTYIKHLARFLANHEIQNEWDNQMVRYYFCGLIGRFYSHLVKSAPMEYEREIVEDIMPFELRMALYQLFQTWCGYGQLAANTREREARMMQVILDQVRDMKERGTLTTMMEDQRKALEIASLKAMASLCHGPLIHASMPTIRFNLHSLLTWIDSIFMSKDVKLHAFAQLALEYMLSSNTDNPELWDLTLKRCYSERPDSVVSIRVFLVLVDIFCRNKPHPCSLQKLIVLALYKIGDFSPIVRKAAGRLVILVVKQLGGLHVPYLESAIPGFLEDVEGHHGQGQDEVQSVGDGIMAEDFESSLTEFVTPESCLISSNVVSVYKDIQFGISDRWARERGELTLALMVEMLYRLDMMPHNSPGIRDILVFLAPWIRNINISHFQSSYTDGTSSETAIAPEVKLCLMNLFYLTIRFGVEFVHELEDIWSQVLLNSEYDFNGMETESSVSIITSYLVAVSLRKRNPSAVMVSKNITVYMARCENAGGLVVDAVMEKIKPEFAVPYDNATLEQSELADIARALPMDPVDTLLIDMPGRPPFSPTQLSLLLLVDAVLQVPPRHILPHLPTLLHAAVVHLDHPSKFIVDECVCLLGSLVQALVPDESMGLFYTLGNEEWKLRYEDLTPPTILSLSSVKTLGRITDRILQVFTKVVPDLQSAWGGVSLKWGIECPVRHIACRSLQIYRCLSPRVFDKRDLSQLLTRCGSTLGDCVSVDVQGYALDCLLTVKVVAKNACPITEFLELWWAGVACLYSPLKWEYEEGLNLLLDLMSRMSQSPTDQLKTSDGIRICKPVTWRGKSCLDMILRGLRVDQELSDKCLKLLNILVPLDNVLDSGVDQRVLYGICANLPSMMASFESTGSALASSASSPEVSATLAPVYKRAKDLHTLCSSLPRLSALSHLLLSFSKQKFRSRDDFIGQTLALLKESFPAETSALLDFFLGLFVCETPEDSKTREQVVQILLSMMRVYEPAVLCSKGGKSLDVWSPLLHYLLSQSVVSESLLQLLELILSSGSGSGEAIEEVVFGERQLVRIQREFGGDKAGEYLSQVKSNMSCTGRVCQSRFLPVVHGVSAE